MASITELGNPAKPNDIAGAQMLARMNTEHYDLTTWGLSFLPLSPSDTLLDIGCGGGKTLQRLAPHVHHLTGLDHSPTSVATSTTLNLPYITQHKMEIIEGNVLSMPFPTSSFDKIITIESFYFWPDPPTSLKEVYRILKSNGTFLLITEIYENEDLSFAARTNIHHYKLFNPTISTFRTLFNSLPFTQTTLHINSQTNWLCITATK